MINEALRKFKADFGVTFYRQLDGYVYEAGTPFGRPNSFRFNVGFSKGQCTTRIKLHVGRDGDVHAFPVLDPATVGGSTVTPGVED